MAVSREDVLASAASIEAPRWVGIGLWVAALAWFGAGDLATTFYGMEVAGTSESVPITAAVIERWGHFGHAFLKVAVFCIAWVYYDELPDLEELGEWYRLAIPLGFTIAGVALTLQNVAHILAAPP